MVQAQTATKAATKSRGGIFSGIEEEEVFPVRQFFDAEKDLGTYKLKVINLVSGIGKLSGKGFFSGNFEVLAAPAGSTKQPGSEVSVTLVANANIKYRTYFLKDSMRLAQAVLNNNDIDEAAVEAITGEDNPCEGAELLATVSAKAKDDGRVFTRVAFKAIG